MSQLNHLGPPAPDTPDWHVTAFLAPPAGEHPMLDAVRTLRAGILADHGRRPAFRRADGTNADDQDLDAGAWHFVARRSPGGPPLGYIRLSTPDTGAHFRSREFLDERFEEVLTAEGFPAAGVFEPGRLVVEHRARELGLGRYLTALAVGAAHHLGARAVIGTFGTKDGQDRFHEQFGFRPVRGTRRYVPQYTEDVVVMLHRVADGGGRQHDLVTRLRDEFPVIAGTAPPVTGPRAPAHEVWRSVLHTAAGVDALLTSGDVREVHNTIDDQLAELADRNTAEPSWAWYPWSGRLVHLLPRAEFRLVRTGREPLAGKRIGIIGLPAGHGAALTFALEGLGESYRLAGAGAVRLSDLRPLRGGVPDLGVGRAVLTARRMAEIDPYLDIEIEPAGLTPETIERFFAGGLDLLVEASGTPWVQVAAREYARDLGIPVLSPGNGVLDVERFDTEPDRPLLHGVLGDVKSVDLLEPGPSEKAAAALADAAPQPAAGGVSCEEAARRILLGLPCASGRFRADLDGQLHPSRTVGGEAV